MPFLGLEVQYIKQMAIVAMRRLNNTWVTFFTKQWAAKRLNFPK